MEIGSRRFAVAIDYGDDTALHPSLLESYDLVFKMQYLSDGYGSDSVVPGGFVPNGLSLYRYLPHLRAARDRGKRTTDAYGRFGREKTAQARNDAVMLLRRQSAFRYKGGFGRVRYGESLFEAARPRVSVDLPGRGPLC